MMPRRPLPRTMGLIVLPAACPVVAGGACCFVVLVVMVAAVVVLVPVETVVGV